MARLFPNLRSDVEVGDGHPGELETLRHLSEELPDHYSVFHSLHWSNAKRDFTQVGEIDFVVVNRSGAVLVIEQKNGALHETDEGLTKRYGNKSKSLNSQVQRNIGGIRSKFSQQHGQEADLWIDYLIYCPDYRLVSVNGAGVDASRIVDQTTRSGLVGRITELLQPGAIEQNGTHDRVCQFFAQSFHVVPDVHTHVAAQDATYTRMLDGLAEGIEKLEFTPFRLRVIGAAGCGKTQLTVREAGRFVAEGRRVLQLCFNRPLADSLQRLAPVGVRVDTYHGFCKAMLESFDEVVTDPSSGGPEYWRKLQEHLVAATIPPETRYDALIVDEGQDFLQEWWEILELFLTDDAAVLWLEDPLQNLRQSPAVELPGFVTYRERANFRSPRSIARFIKGALGIDFDARNKLPGLGVHIEEIASESALAKALTHRLIELVRMGFKPEQIVIVSCRGMGSSALKDATMLGTYRLKRFTGQYAQGRQTYTEGNVAFETIYRFKGQQSPAVILVDVDARLDRSDWSRQILYCAMTRATVRLEVIGQADCPWLPDFKSHV